MLALFFSIFIACAKPGVATEDAGLLQVEADAGAPLTAGLLDAWLRWQARGALLDAGADVRVRAGEEARLLRSVGLTPADAERVEALVAAVVSERNLERISGAEALAQFRASLAQLSEAQRVKAGAALGAATVDGGGGLPQATQAFGPEAVALVLAREAEVTRAWEALLQAQHGVR